MLVSDFDFVHIPSREETPEYFSSHSSLVKEKVVHSQETISLDSFQDIEPINKDLSRLG